MVDEHVTARVLHILNEAAALDPDAMVALLNHRVPVNQDLVQKSPIICLVGVNHDSMGVLGLLNGICSDGKPAIWAVVDFEEGTDVITKVLRFERIPEGYVNIPFKLSAP